MDGTGMDIPGGTIGLLYKDIFVCMTTPSHKNVLTSLTTMSI